MKNEAIIRHNSRHSDAPLVPQQANVVTKVDVVRDVVVRRRNRHRAPVGKFVPVAAFFNPVIFLVDSEVPHAVEVENRP